MDLNRVISDTHKSHRTTNIDERQQSRKEEREYDGVDRQLKSRVDLFCWQKIPPQRFWETDMCQPVGEGSSLISRKCEQLARGRREHGRGAENDDNDDHGDHRTRASVRSRGVVEDFDISKTSRRRVDCNKLVRARVGKAVSVPFRKSPMQ